MTGKPVCKGCEELRAKNKKLEEELKVELQRAISIGTILIGHWSNKEGYGAKETIDKIKEELNK